MSQGKIVFYIFGLKTIFLNQCIFGLQSQSASWRLFPSLLHLGRELLYIKAYIDSARDISRAGIFQNKHVNNDTSSNKNISLAFFSSSLQG